MAYNSLPQAQVHPDPAREEGRLARDHGIPHLSPFLTASEVLEGLVPPDIGERAKAALDAMARHVSIHLIRGDRTLGRPGAICPFAFQGSRTGGVLFADCDLPLGKDQEIAEVMCAAHAISVERDRQESDERRRVLQAIVVTFSQFEGPGQGDLIESTQRNLKSMFVASGLMLGEFFPGCQTPGLRNPAFHSLDAPISTLVVRHMVLGDAPFLRAKEDHRRAYLERFGEEGAARFAILDRAVPA